MTPFDGTTVYSGRIIIPAQKPQSEFERLIDRWEKQVDAVAMSRELSITEPPPRLLRPQRPGPVSRERTFRCRGARR